MAWSSSVLLGDHRAVALVHRPEGLVAGNGGDELIVIPWTLGLRRLLDFEEIHVVHVAAVGADVALAEYRIVPLGFLEGRHHLVGIVGAGRLDSVEIGERRRIEA